MSATGGGRGVLWVAPPRIVVMGVAGSGKSTVASMLGERLGLPVAEADDFHLATSTTKMAAGEPLTDDDRWPWLVRLKRELDQREGAVITCSGLRRSYRDLLRRVSDVRFVFLDVTPDEARRRAAAREGHFMAPTMIESQFTTLERPGADEADVLRIDATLAPSSICTHIIAMLDSPAPVSSAAPVLQMGGTNAEISIDELTKVTLSLAETEILATGARRVLLVPPDHTRLHSRAGEITATLYEKLVASGCAVAVLPALGTHSEMSPDDSLLLFGDRVPFSAIRHHRWRDGLDHLGTIGENEVAEVSGGRLRMDIPIAVDEELFGGWDLVVSVGQVVPHEVIGMANFTKNIVIGLGGAPTVHRSHYLGAVCDMETLMGRADGPVRHVVDAAFDRFIAPRVSVLWLLTVMEDTDAGVVQRGMFAGRGRSSESGGAAYRAAAELAAACNVTVLETPMRRVACFLDPAEFRTTWLGNKAIYRTRMAIADEGELLVLAPGVTHFGEDPAIDALIRTHGYRGTAAAMAAVDADVALAANLGAAAHLVHGSSEGRFTITYCTDPASGGLTPDEVEGVGFRWADLSQTLTLLALPSGSPFGTYVDASGEQFVYIPNPALGLWATAERFAR